MAGAEAGAGAAASILARGAGTAFGFAVLAFEGAASRSGRQWTQTFAAARAGFVVLVFLPQAQVKKVFERFDMAGSNSG